MSMAVLIIVLGVHFPYELRIQFEDIFDCHTAMDNFYLDFHRKIDRGLTLPPVKVSCKTLVKQQSPKSENGK